MFQVLLIVSIVLQRYSQEVYGPGVIQPIRSQKEYEDYMTWLAQKKAHLRSGSLLWHRARDYMARLAVFHGYVPTSFKWEDSEVVKDLSRSVNDDARAKALDTEARTVNQENNSLAPSELKALYKHAMGLQAATCALLLAFCGITEQTLARPGQLCKMNRVHMSLYPKSELPKSPLFGPVKMMQLGDRGHHKVDKDDPKGMSHWVMRTYRPSLACPWFGLALKAALDAKQRAGAQYDDIMSQTTGKDKSGCVQCKQSS